MRRRNVLPGHLRDRVADGLTESSRDMRAPANNRNPGKRWAEAGQTGRAEGGRLGRRELTQSASRTYKGGVPDLDPAVQTVER